MTQTADKILAEAADLRDFIPVKFYTADGKDAIKKIVSFLGEPQDSDETAARQISRQEGEPHPDMPAYLWHNQTNCYILKDTQP